MGVHTAEEEQQLEAVKKWWRENGKSIVVGLVLGFAALAGARWWMEQRARAAEAASAQYEQVMAAAERQDREAVLRGGAELIAAYPDTTYAVMAALFMAKASVEQGALAEARVRLQWALAHAEQPELAHLARLRLARILLAEGEVGQALTLIGGAEPQSFAAASEELRGDIRAAQGERDAARDAYRRALAALPEGVGDERLRLKLDDLGGAESEE